MSWVWRSRHVTSISNPRGQTNGIMSTRFKKNAFATGLVLLALGFTLLLSVGVVAAGDGSATTTKFQARLAAQVQAGQLTQEQADARIAGRAAAHAKRAARIEAKLAKLVESGTLSQDEADAKLSKVLTKPWKPGRYKAKLAKLVQAGTLSQDEADAKAWKRLIKPRKASSYKAKFAKLVEAGTLSQDQADAKLKKHLKKPRPMALYRVKFANLVEHGKLTQAEADAKLALIETKKDKRAKKKAERKGS